MAVTAVAAYQWLKAVLFGQLFWDLWSSAQVPSLSGPNQAVFVLLAVALYLFVLGWGLWNLKKWALLLLLIVWLPDLAYDISPESFGLWHTADLWVGDQSLFIFLGITIGDMIAFPFIVNRSTYKAFHAEGEANFLEMMRWIFWWT